MHDHKCLDVGSQKSGLSTNVSTLLRARICDAAHRRWELKPVRSDALLAWHYSQAAEYHPPVPDVAVQCDNSPRCIPSTAA